MIREYEKNNDDIIRIFKESDLLDATEALKEYKSMTYILRCSDGTLYCGWTNDIEKRLYTHNSGAGAKYTKARRPVELVYLEVYLDKRYAMKREYEIKHMTRKKKLELIKENS